MDQNGEDHSYHSDHSIQSDGHNNQNYNTLSPHPPVMVPDEDPSFVDVLSPYSAVVMHQQQQQQHHVNDVINYHLYQQDIFFADQTHEIENMTDFKTHSLPLARIKKIMKADEDVRMIAAEAPVVFSRACEMFILQLTLQAWAYAEENKRRTLQKNDIAMAISNSDSFDFLIDVIPREDLREEHSAVGVVGDSLGSNNFYYIQ
ncbi:Nuclear transcription factor Y subunit C-2 [Zostera marina]|uniref:Nuclear transcription factor Y subunit C-2 n=1 Tax=Zostera marina TaxID=29655 RepID=A0A0K9PAB1_ZOSMR|nr:Nuclear transcription factor Y subunit C-2 [Zostera marina]